MSIKNVRPSWKKGPNWKKTNTGLKIYSKKVPEKRVSWPRRPCKKSVRWFIDMNYKIHLEKFEGPLDLLLYLIKKNDIDICDIPIAIITEQYMGYIEMMKMLDLD